MPPNHSRAAAPWHFGQWRADVPGMGRSPGRPVSTEDVGDLERGAHRDQPLGLAVSPVGMPICAVILSSGLVTVRTILVATRV